MSLDNKHHEMLINIHVDRFNMRSDIYGYASVNIQTGQYT